MRAYKLKMNENERKPMKRESMKACKNNELRAYNSRPSKPHNKKTKPMKIQIHKSLQMKEIIKKG